MVTKIESVQPGKEISPTQLEELVGAATLAPSPDNNQPWLFEAYEANRLVLYHDLARALCSDVDYMFSMMALGAALENLCIAARQQGWDPVIDYVVQEPTTRSTGTGGSAAPAIEAVATVRLQAGGCPDPLVEFLAERVSCRKSYDRSAVPKPELDALDEALAGFDQLELHWVASPARIELLGWLVARSDRIRLESQPFHQELFGQLRFSPQDAEQTRDGLDLRCLELPGIGRAVLKWLRPWSRMQALNRVGMSRLLSLPSAMLLWTSGTVGLLTTTGSDRQAFLQAGRALERVWLTATKLGLAVHPLGSLAIFLRRLTWQADQGLCQEHQRKLGEIHGVLQQVFPGTRGKAWAMLFRLGRAARPDVRSLRRPVGEVLRIR